VIGKTWVIGGPASSFEGLKEKIVVALAARRRAERAFQDVAGG